jgi:hypothetical protein
MSSLAGTIQATATNWAAQLTSLAKSFSPKHLQPFIKTRTSSNGDGTFALTIYVDKDASPAQNYGSKDAEAQEFGWKANGTMISPKNAPRLVFMGTNDFVGKLIVTPHSVRAHDIPKFNGQGYLAPAIDALRDKGVSKLKEDVRRAILDDVRVSFEKAKK